MSRAGPKGLKVVSNWKFCAASENQRLTCRTWGVFQIRRHYCHGKNLAKNLKYYFLVAGVMDVMCNQCLQMLVFVVNNIKLYFISVCFLTSCKISFELFLLPWLQPYFISCINVSYMNFIKNLKKFVFFNLFFHDKLHFMNCRP